MTDKHQPDPEFVARLEWRLMSEMRREQLFETSRISTSGRWARVAALVVFSALLGVAGVKAAEGWEQAEQRRFAIARAEIGAELAQAKAALAEEFFEDRLDAFEAGTIDRVDLAMSELELEEIRMEAEVASLRLEELMVSGEGPRGELHAPLVGGRDFVMERLEAVQRLSQKREEVAELYLEQAKRRFEIGAGSAQEVRSAEDDVRQVRQEVDRLQQLIELRRRFIAEGIEPRQVEALSQLEQARLQVRETQRRLSAGQAEIEEARKRLAAGAISELDLKAAEFQLLQIEAEHQLASMELEFLERRARHEP